MEEIMKHTHTYLYEKAPVLYLELDSAGRVSDQNRYCRKIMGTLKPGSLFSDTIIDFNAVFDLNEAVDSQKEYLLSVNTDSGMPLSYLFSFVRSEKKILVFGKPDETDAELMRTQVVQLNQELNNSTRMLHKKNAELRQALNHVKLLQGIIPICSHCHKIRDDDQVWEKLETYLAEHTDARFSHGICPDCMIKFYPDMAEDD